VRSHLAKRFQFLTVLRHRDYRIYYIGLLASVASHQGMMAAQGWLVFDITRQPVALGFVGAAQAIPGIVFNLLAGALADRIDPRRMIVFGEGAAALLMALLAVLVLTDIVQVWHIIGIAFLVGIATSFDQPARRVVWPALIPRSEYASGTALNQGVWNGTRVVGPAISTGLIGVVAVITGDARLGAGVAFVMISAGFAAMVVAIGFVQLPEMRRAGGATVLHDIKDGLVFVATHRIFLILMGLSFSVGYFGLSYQYLLPAFAGDTLGLSPLGLGALYVSSGVGGIIGIFVAASYGNSIDRSKLIGIGATLMGVSIIGVGVTGRWDVAALSAVLVATSAMLYSTFQIGANTLMNLLIPTEFRGRVMGLRGIMWSLSPLGALQAGFIAGYTSVPFAIGVGGVAVMLITATVWVLSKQLRNAESLVNQVDEYEASMDEPAAERSNT
jgi:MFS family permease